MPLVHQNSTGQPWAKPGHPRLSFTAYGEMKTWMAGPSPATGIFLKRLRGMRAKQRHYQLPHQVGEGYRAERAAVVIDHRQAVGAARGHRCERVAQ